MKSMAVTVSVTVNVLVPDDFPVGSFPALEAVKRHVRWYSDGRYHFDVESMQNAATNVVLSGIKSAVFHHYAHERRSSRKRDLESRNRQIERTMSTVSAYVDGEGIVTDIK